MELPTGLAVLCPRAGSPAQAAALATRLGEDPLPGRLAAAYLARTGPGPATFTEYRMEVLLRGAPSLDTAVELALERLDDEGLGQARTLLRLLAVLPDGPLPYRKLLDPVLLADDELFPRLTASHLEALLDGLTELALVDRTPATLTVHPGVRALAEIDGRRSGQRPAHVALLVNLLFAATADAEAGIALAPAAVHVLQLLVEEGHDPDAVDLLANSCLHLGDALAAAGRYAEARDLGTAVVGGVRRVFGPTHSRTLLGSTFLAGWTGRAGDPAGAYALLSEVTAAYRLAPGPVDPDALVAFANRAYWAGLAGDAVAARDAYAELVPLRTRSAGPDDPDVLFERGELAHWTGLAGDAAGAHALFSALLADAERLWGPDGEDVAALRRAVSRWAS